MRDWQKWTAELFHQKEKACGVMPQAFVDIA